MLSEACAGTKPLYEGVTRNKDKWFDLANNTDTGLTLTGDDHDIYYLLLKTALVIKCSSVLLKFDLDFYLLLSQHLDICAKLHLFYINFILLCGPALLLCTNLHKMLSGKMLYSWHSTLHDIAS